MKQLLLFIFLVPLFSFSQWVQEGNDIDGTNAGDASGTSVSLNANGTVVAIGAPNHFSVTAGNGGQVRVYENIGGVWTQIGSDIVPIAINEGSFFGHDVTLNASGTILAASAHWANNFAGYVRVFENISGVWTQIGNDIVGEADIDVSGTSISLNANGNIIAIGAPANDGNGGVNLGQVRVYENVSGVWTQIGIDIDGDANDDTLGVAVSLNDLGNILVVGAPAVDNGNNPGYAKVFENVSGVWTQIGINIIGDAENDNFGIAVSINSMGTIIAISSYDGPNTLEGYVKVYENISGVWTQIGSKLIGEANHDDFGFSVSLNSDGTILAVGAPANDASSTATNANFGHVRVYENIAGVWTQSGSDIDGEANGDASGSDISLSDEGNILAIGATANNNSNGVSGHVRLYNNPTLSVISNTFGPLFKMFPNPSHNSTTINLGNSFQNINVSVFDILGKEVLNKSYNNTNEAVLNTKQLTTGIYIVKVEADTKKESLKLVIKQ